MTDAPSGDAAKCADSSARVSARARVLAGLPAALVAACGLLPTSSGDAYLACAAADADESSLATLELGPAQWAVIDDAYYVDRAKHGVVKLPAGTHRIDTEATFGVSFLVDPRMIVERSATASVLFEAGRTYRLRADRTTGPDYQTFIWIEDASDGRVIAGSKKP